MAALKSINDVILYCALCRAPCAIRDAIPCANDGSGFGCPVPDCGGMLVDRDQTITAEDIVRVE
jgi:hypothetical protein